MKWLVTIEEFGPFQRTRFGPFGLVKAICFAGGVAMLDAEHRVQVQPMTPWAMDWYGEAAPICQGMMAVSAGLALAKGRMTPLRIPRQVSLN